MKDRRITVQCYCCGIVELPWDQYMVQLSKPNESWYCPGCGLLATFYKNEYNCLDPYCSGWADMEGSEECDTCGEWQFALWSIYGEQGIERWQQCYKNEEIEYSVEWRLNEKIKLEISQ